ncbi:NADH:flavin oxidoreductase/NADH oxidase family protein [Labilibaculum antarcticum]|uniref:Oxidoreductase n=1 Tax=Labilibaculum antarcticum TaxID=1717717 RepID=A0A1Y1CEF5_9BACT|nr:NADH:flavin oxidoreductase/NADH oxidase family protein [Labilibaculum antarcticum]BAX78738.1 oxidoreductase [Labilibaculum antarcticum]
MVKRSDSNNILQRELQLPCGAILKNRLSKSPMSDSLGDGEGNPTEAQIRLYEKWADGGIALSIVGEVHGDSRFPEKPGNLILNENSNHEIFKSFTSRAVIEGAHLWAQLGHAGALSHLPISLPKGPSALNLESLKCEGMSINDIQELPQMYARTALQAKTVGFSGVLIHAGHGFLLSQFLSPLFNHRTDRYGGSIESRCRIILEVIKEVRNAVGPSFPVGIRINSSDQLEGGLTEVDALEVVRFIDKTSIDLIDISGGTYFPGAKASSEGSSAGPYFLDFAKRARSITTVPLMLTGGFKKSDQAVDAIASGVVDMVGLGRAMVLDPRLPKSWLSGNDYEPNFPRFKKTIPGGMTAWYTMRLIALGEDRENEFELDLPTAIKKYEDRDAQRAYKWKNKFPL